MDLIEIGLGIDSTPITSATKNLDGLGDAWARAVSKIVSENKRMESAIKASAEVQAKAEEAVSQSVETKTLIAIGKKIKLMEASKDAATRQAAAEIKAIQDKQKAEDAELADWFAQQRRKLSMMAESEKMAQRQAAEEARLAGSVNTYNQVLQQSQDRSRRFSLVTQQAGYQMGDFIVQVQSGTNAFVAFGQQATQMVGFLPNMAEELGLASSAAAKWMLGLSIAIPLITAVAAGIMRTNSSFNLGKEVTVSYSDVIKGLTEDIKKNQEEFLKAKYGTDNQNVADARKNIQDFAKELDDINKKLAGGQVQNFGTAVGTGLAQDTLARRKVELESILQPLRDQEEAQRMLNGGLSVAGGLQKAWLLNQQESKRTQEELNGLIDNASKKAVFDAQVDLNNKAQEIVLQQNILQYGKDSVQVANQKAKMAADAVSLALREQFAKDGISKAEQSIIDLAKQQAYQYEVNAGLIDRQTQGAQNLASAMRDVSSAMKGLLSFSDGLDKALNEANIKVDLLKKGVKSSVAGTVASMQAQLDQKMEAANKAGINPSILSGMFGGEQAKIDALTKSLSEAEKLAAAQSKSGGGMSASTVENKLKDLYKYLDATKQINQYLIDEEDIAFKQREDLLKSALDKKLITLQEYQTMEVDLTRRHQEELAKIEATRQNTQLQDTATFFGGLAAVAQAGGDKMTRVARVFSAAQALTNSYLAFTQVLADPSLVGRPFARFGMAASALASGLQAVAAIRGGGGSIGSVGSAGAAGLASAAPQQVMIQGLKPTDIFTGEQLSTLFDNLYKENRNRGMVFMVQR